MQQDICDLGSQFVCLLSSLERFELNFFSRVAWFNISVRFKNTAISIRGITVFQSKLFNHQNLSIKSMKKESNIVDSLINWCHGIFILQISPWHIQIGHSGIQAGDQVRVNGSRVSCHHVSFIFYLWDRGLHNGMGGWSCPWRGHLQSVVGVWG